MALSTVKTTRSPPQRDDTDFDPRGCTQPLHCQQVVDAEAAKLFAVWQVDHTAPGLMWLDMLGEALPLLCVDAVMQACDSLAADSSLGWDQIHPRALKRLSRPALRALLRILILCEIFGTWPQVIGIVIIALLPKSDGGLRPIGLCPSLVRLWMAIRMPVAQAWQAAHERPYFFAGTAKGAEVATWKQAAFDEMAAGEQRRVCNRVAGPREGV